LRSVKVSIQLFLFIILFTATGVALYFILDDLHSGPFDYSNVEVLSGGVQRVIVIDPGHGGIDGGAVASDGTLEKDLNLAIAKDVAQILKYNGFRVILTRETDTMLGSGEAGKLKRADLNERLKIADAEGNVLVSIHMNKYPDSRPKGLQVYYSKNNADSQPLAEYIQSTVVATLQPQNKRKVKAAGSEIFILNKATVPAVLIECGFLSNEEELSLLKSEDYQRQLSSVIAAAIMNGTNN